MESREGSWEGGGEALGLGEWGGLRLTVWYFGCCNCLFLLLNFNLSRSRRTA